MNLSLQEVIIVGSYSEQVKFSELTIDMFRMLQTLEREPQEDLSAHIAVQMAAQDQTNNGVQQSIYGSNSSAPTTTSAVTTPVGGVPVTPSQDGNRSLVNELHLSIKIMLIVFQ